MQAQLLLENGNIYTMDRRQPRATSLAIGGGRILAVGSSADVAPWRGPETVTVDLGGRLVVPGLIDAHLHFLSYGLSLREIDLIGVPSLEAAQARVAERAAQTPAGQWLTGRGWDQVFWPGQRFPTR